MCASMYSANESSRPSEGALSQERLPQFLVTHASVQGEGHPINGDSYSYKPGQIVISDGPSKSYRGEVQVDNMSAANSSRQVVGSLERAVGGRIRAGQTESQMVDEMRRAFREADNEAVGAPATGCALRLAVDNQGRAIAVAGRKGPDNILVSHEGKFSWMLTQDSRFKAQGYFPDGSNTRLLGDSSQEPPEVASIALNPGEKYAFLVVTDGITDVMKGRERHFLGVFRKGGMQAVVTEAGKIRKHLGARDDDRTGVSYVTPGFENAPESRAARGGRGGAQKLPGAVSYERGVRQGARGGISQVLETWAHMDDPVVRNVLSGSASLIGGVAAEAVSPGSLVPITGTLWVALEGAALIARQTRREQQEPESVKARKPRRRRR